MILGSYPVKVDRNNKDHHKITQHFHSLLTGLRYMLPCKFCRRSFEQFSQELPIKEFMGSRMEMMLWLYLIKDKVNTKLLGQEKDYLVQCEKEYINGKITRKGLLAKKEHCFHTEPSPPFKQVLEYYTQFSAECSDKVQKCIAKDSLVF